MNNLVVTSNQVDLKKNIVSMANQLIRASQKLSLNEKRIISACISLIDSRKEMTDEKYQVTKYRLFAKDFGKLFDIDEKHAYTYLEQASISLLERVGQFRDKNGVTRFNWVDFVKYRYGYLDIAFGSVIKPFLHNLKREFTIYKFKNACNFKSVYTWRIYELLQSYKLKYLSQKLSTEMTEKHCEKFLNKIKLESKLSHEQALLELHERDEKIKKGRSLPKKLKIKLDTLREQLDIPDSYKWQDIKRQCIETAIKEIKRVNHIEINYKVFKTGKLITSIELEWKTQQQLDLIEEVERKKQ